MVVNLVYLKRERVELSWEQSEVKKGPESWGGVTPLN